MQVERVERHASIDSFRREAAEAWSRMESNENYAGDVAAHMSSACLL